jgi:hypothetical protein
VWYLDAQREGMNAGVEIQLGEEETVSHFLMNRLLLSTTTNGVSIETTGDYCRFGNLTYIGFRIEHLMGRAR